MPCYSCLIILCGVPCTGKSLFAEQLKEALLTFRGGLVDENSKVTVHIAKDEPPGVNKVSQHASGAAEKVARAHLKGNIERLLSLGGKSVGEGAINRGGGGGGGGGKAGKGSDGEPPSWNIVIADGLNYIKGYRYELYCIARTASAAYCCAWIGADAAVRTNGQETGIAKCIRLNAKRRKEQGVDAGYDDKDLRDLYLRFEAPDDRNRWDAPLVRVVAATLPESENGDKIETLSSSLSDVNVSGDKVSTTVSSSSSLLSTSSSCAPFLTSKFDLGTVLSATERSESSAVREQQQQQQQEHMSKSLHHNNGTSVFSRSQDHRINNKKKGAGISHASSSTDVADMRDFEGILPPSADGNVGQEGLGLPQPSTRTVSSFKRAIRPAAAAASAASSRPQFEKIPEVAEESEVINASKKSDQQQSAVIATNNTLADGTNITMSSAISSTTLSWEDGIVSICGLTLGRGRASLMPVIATSSLPTFSSSSLAQSVAVTATVEASFVAALDAGLLKAGGSFTCEYGDQKPVVIKLKRLPKGSGEIRALRREYDRLSTDTVLCGSIITGNEGLENFATFLEDSLSR